MSVARVWRRQLYGASMAALIVPCAMLAALVVLALGGAFSGVGVLGQLFAGPSLGGALPGAGPGSDGGARGAARGVATASLPVIPASVVARRVAGRAAPTGRTVLTTMHHGVGAGGGAIAPAGTTRPVTSGGSAAPVHNPSAPAPTPAAPPAPQPSPPPPKTPVDTVVTVVTDVTQQVPAPAGPVATQVVQAAGSAADNLLPVSGQSALVP